MANEKTVMAVIRAARPSFRNNHDKIAFAVHASFLASGYVLTATGPAASSDTAFSSPSTDEVGMDNWQELDDEYAFVYTNPEKGSKKVLVKCLAMHDKLLVDALAEGASEPVHLEISVGDYAVENGGTNYSTRFKNLEELVKSLDALILSKLDGSSRPSSSNDSSSETSEASRSNIIGVPFGRPPGPQVHPSGILYPSINPIGGSDLFPGPGAGMYPTRGDFGIGGSMLLGPNDPSWLGGVAGDPAFPGGQLGVPPGARFDPYGPPGVPGFEPNRFSRAPRRPGSGTHPDLEHFGSGSDFI
ncbi:probable proteasome inhibitor isoform X1 [Corylus avellana]|uniref:probable proteasome inhibitor isoform X1 n=1 Tax=Corylus avellana TaxID=13451 RepID=UPI00286A2E64|nr:probable proteasome inhibitor isoform X1 [Corylus avellana]